MEFKLDCNQLEKYVQRFHPETTLGDLETSERMNIFPELILMSAVEVGYIESTPEYKRLNREKIINILNEYCKE